MAKVRPTLGAVIVDFDGTLADTGALIREIYRDICERLCLPFEDGDVQPGIPPQELIAAIAARHERSTNAWNRRWAERQFRTMHFARVADRPDVLVPNAADLLRGLRNSGVRTAIATSGFRMVELVRSLGIADVLDAVVDRDDVARGKPAPDLFLEAARRLDIAPHRCCGIEDAPAGIAAIAAAGMCPIGIITAEVDAEELGRAGAFIAYSTLAYLSASDLGPIYRDWQHRRR